MINPSSGPGNGSLTDPNYLREIPKLNAFPNVRTIGYVRIAWTTRDINAVLDDVSTYASWRNANTSLQLHGIFYDETPNNYTESGIEYMQRIDEFAKGHDGFGGVNYVKFPSSSLKLFELIRLDRSQPRLDSRG